MSSTLVQHIESQYAKWQDKCPFHADAAQQLPPLPHGLVLRIIGFLPVRKQIQLSGLSKEVHGNILIRHLSETVGQLTTHILKQPKYRYLQTLNLYLNRYDIDFSHLTELTSVTPPTKCRRCRRLGQLCHDCYMVFMSSREGIITDVNRLMFMGEQNVPNYLLSPADGFVGRINIGGMRKELEEEAKNTTRQRLKKLASQLLSWYTTHGGPWGS